MLNRVQRPQTTAAIPLLQAQFPTPFSTGLTYSPPARGGWNIVHVGMQVPQAHLIFVCAQGCLRGVVLTAAEMGAQTRFSTVAIRTQDVLNGDLEALLVDGVSDILTKLPEKPPAVLVYTSCIHHFMGTDLKLAYRQLRQRFPDIQFTDCYMNPIMRKSGLNPDQTMRRQLYSLLQPAPLVARAVNIIGNDFKLQPQSDLVRLLQQHQFKIREAVTCTTYKQYQQLATSQYNITTRPAAKPAAEMLAQRFGQIHLALPFSFNAQEIEQQLTKLAQAINVLPLDYQPLRAAAKQALYQARQVVGSTEIAIDASATSRPLGLARLLLTDGFNVTRLYLDQIGSAEKADLMALKQLAPDLLIFPTVQPDMRQVSRHTANKVLAIGQKAAYFCGTNYFVNLIQDGGLYGFGGIQQLAQMMVAAVREPKDTQALITVKGWGCHCS